MAADKLVDSTQLNADLTSVANAIRTKGGISEQLEFPDDFVDAIGNIQTGDGYSQNDVAIANTTNSETRNGLDGEWDITGRYIPEWALSHTNISKIKITFPTAAGISGYLMGDRALSRGKFEYVYIKILKTSGNYLNKSYILQGCGNLKRVCIDGVVTALHNNTFNGCPALTDIYVSWSDGDVAGAPWSATNATVHYDSTFDSDGNPIV